MQLPQPKWPSKRSPYMLKIASAILLLVIGLYAIYSIYGLALFNALVPQDEGAREVAIGVHFGPGPRQVVDIYAPAAAGTYPVLVFVHGGSWASGNRQDYGFVGRAFAAHGFVTVISEYRLVPEVRYPGFVDDTAAAITWASEHAVDYSGDSTRLFVMGHSAGAYNVVQAVLSHHLEDRVKAMVTLAGPFDFLPLDTSASIAAFSQAPDLPSTQPVNLDLSQAPPLLILHGADDSTVGVYHARHLSAKYQAAGREVEVKIYPGVSHVAIMLGLSKYYRQSVPTFADALAFLRAHGG
jgi:acetyl esterase/lipase